MPAGIEFFRSEGQINDQKRYQGKRAVAQRQEIRIVEIGVVAQQ